MGEPGSAAASLLVLAGRLGICGVGGWAEPTQARLGWSRRSTLQAWICTAVSLLP